MLTSLTESYDITVLVSSSHCTSAPSASNISRIGTSVWSFSIKGVISTKETLFPFTVTVMLSSAKAPADTVKTDATANTDAIIFLFTIITSEIIILFILYHRLQINSILYLIELTTSSTGSLPVSVP